MDKKRPNYYIYSILAKKVCEDNSKLMEVVEVLIEIAASDLIEFYGVDIDENIYFYLKKSFYTWLSKKVYGYSSPYPNFLIELPSYRRVDQTVLAAKMALRVRSIISDLFRTDRFPKRNIELKRAKESILRQKDRFSFNFELIDEEKNKYLSVDNYKYNPESYLLSKDEIKTICECELNIDEENDNVDLDSLLAKLIDNLNCKGFNYGEKTEGEKRV